MATRAEVYEQKAGVEYREVSSTEVPVQKLHFATPKHLMGQSVEVSYGGFETVEYGAGAPYKRVYDGGDGSTRYFKLA